MSKHEYEKHITRFELTNQCVLFQEDNGTVMPIKLPADAIAVHSIGKTYPATLREFYLKGKFVPGLSFEEVEGKLSEFFFDHSVTELKRAHIIYTEGEADAQGRPIVHLEITMHTQPHK